MKIVRGSCRIVMMFPGWGFVIKIALIRCFFKGLLENWRERTFYRKTRHQFLARTYFSLFGLVNLQRWHPPPTPQQYDGFARLWKGMNIATAGAVERDRHHFAGIENYGMDGGRFVMVDYGSREAQAIIKEHGLTILSCTHVIRREAA